MQDTLYTRKQYMEDYSGDNSEPFHRYYAQFATPEVIEYVVRAIGADKILASTDEHLNDIPLRRWDALTPPINWQLLREANGNAGVSLSDKVCIAKEAARIFKA